MTKQEERKVVKAINALSKAVQALNEASGGSNPIISFTLDNPSIFSDAKKYTTDVHLRLDSFNRIAEMLGAEAINEYDVPVGDHFNHYFQFVHDGISFFAIQ